MNTPNTPLLSVVVSVYKCESFIERTVRSLFSQNFDDVEFIFVDDCSPDRSIEVIKIILDNEYPACKPFVRFLFHEINQGAFITKYDGISAASGKYIYVVDSDDWIEPDTFKRYVEAAEESQADIVYGNYFREHSEQGNRSVPVYVENIDVRFAEDKDSLMSDILAAGVFQGMAFWINVFRRSLWTEAHISVPDKRVFDDTYCVPILYYHAKKIRYADFFAYHYVRYNLSSFTRRSLNTDAAEITYNSMLKAFADKCPRYLPSIDQVKANYKIYIIRNSKTREDFLNVARLFLEINMDEYRAGFSPVKKLVWYCFKKKGIQDNKNHCLYCRQHFQIKQIKL
ncbi:MAG: glycosyltransferase [Dysgonamonadaceae bacterium]|jgi:glycosyltransferase involved in cell wall biosynthesis|nr:glycosyltransferase [Dysgonamonadaceae bacterium]